MWGFFLFFLQFLEGALLLLTVFSEIQLMIAAFFGFGNGFLNSIKGSSTWKKVIALMCFPGISSICKIHAKLNFLKRKVILVELLYFINPVINS